MELSQNRKGKKRSPNATQLTEKAIWARVQNDGFQKIKIRSTEAQKDDKTEQETKLKGRQSVIFQCDKYKKVKKGILVRWQ